MSVTPIYAGLFALVYVVLSLRVIAARRTVHVDLGDGGNTLLRRRQRMHGNFAEYVPMAVILLALAEAQASPPWLLHSLGVTLLLGRVAHAWGVSQEPEPAGARVLGMALTFAALIGGAAVNLAAAVGGAICRSARSRCPVVDAERAAGAWRTQQAWDRGVTARSSPRGWAASRRHVRALPVDLLV